MYLKQLELNHSILEQNPNITNPNDWSNQQTYVS